MQRFAALYAALDASTSTRHKRDVLTDYLRAAPAEDAAWAVYFLAGGRPRRSVPARTLRAAVCAAAAIPDWLFEECYQAVGDLAETIAHLLPAAQAHDAAGLAQWMHEHLLPLRDAPADEVAARLHACWARLDPSGRYVMNKLITGGFRVGVSRQTVTRALGAAFGIDERIVARRMIGYADAKVLPDAQRFRALVAAVDGDTAHHDPALPYPFLLAHPLLELPHALGAVDDWLVEWKWDGIRAQLVRRAGTAWLWSRGEELVTERFPELAAAAAALPDGVVLDGEVLAWDHAAQRPKPFATLQTRVARRTLSARVLRDAPAVFVAYDLLEQEGVDLRARPQAERRDALEALMRAHAGPQLRLSPQLAVPDWDAVHALRTSARAADAEGLMLKRRSAAYGAGRVKTAPAGDWWKWKVDPYTIDAVLIYAQRGHGRRASLYTDFTFAVWAEDGLDGGGDAERDGPDTERSGPDAERSGPGAGTTHRRLVPFAKAYSGLTDAELAAVDAVVRRTTIEKFGPVRSVRPTLVFELGFEGIQPSPRHRSGIAVRFPRILRWRTDKGIDAADTLDTLRAMLRT